MQPGPCEGFSVTVSKKRGRRSIGRGQGSRDGGGCRHRYREWGQFEEAEKVVMKQCDGKTREKQDGSERGVESASR